MSRVLRKQLSRRSSPEIVRQATVEEVSSGEGDAYYVEFLGLGLAL